ncbi:hypothetical protein GCM10007049_29580 [Echinicola pacifica]|uniref:DUF4843 domain-containing protein n=1 Tax=Echinicola pacifica TaxID=346377 RepID=A0A918Q5A7_9BACT|nr:hypothetical protein [Echinicola pacifica]GGZ34296.1 hypothetical protein GCM10007049_29580 [Echinicola pacifica]
MGTNAIVKKAGLLAQLLLVLILASFSCEDDDTLYLSKAFQLPIDVIPQKEIFKVGNTIYVNINFPKILSDKDKTVQYLFEDYDFGTSVRIVELKDKTQPLAGQPGSIQSFKFINQVGGIYPFGAGGGELKLVFTGDTYIYKGKIILKKPGIYNISFMSDFSSIATVVKAPSGYKHIIAGVGPSFTLVNSGIPLNYHLFVKYTASEFETSDDSDTQARSFFPFVVVE